MNRQTTFQERREAFAAHRGRLVDMREDDSPPFAFIFIVIVAAVIVAVSVAIAAAGFS